MTTTLKKNPISIDQAYDLCAEEVRLRARNFWYGLRLLPPEQFKALCAVYSWMRRADDLADADDGPDAESRESALRAYQHRTRALFAGAGAEGLAELDVPKEEEHVLRAMSAVIESYHLDPHDFDMMIDGQLADLVPRTVQTRSELITYCDQVASTVGRVCVCIWGAGDDGSLKLATTRGIAFQITNILRDIREDHERGRCYIPADELSAAGLDIDGLLDWSDPKRCTRFVKEQAQIAKELYEQSAELDAVIEPACRPTSWAMTTIYRSLLEKIAHRPRLIVGPGRVRLSSLRKIAIALRARRLAWYGFGERGGVVE